MAETQPSPPPPTVEKIGTMPSSLPLHSGFTTMPQPPPPTEKNTLPRPLPEHAVLPAEPDSALPYLQEPQPVVAASTVDVPPLPLKDDLPHLPAKASVQLAPHVPEKSLSAPHPRPTPLVTTQWTVHPQHGFIESPTSQSLTLTDSPLATSSSSPFTSTSTSPPPPRRPHLHAVTKGGATSTGKTPIRTTCILDPCLRQLLTNIPNAVRSTTDSALSAASAYPDGSFSWTTGAPIGGIAQLARQYIVPPDARFVSEKGGMSLELGVVDQEGPGVPVQKVGADGVPVVKNGKPVYMHDKRRTTGRVEVVTTVGGVDIDISLLDLNRQIDLRIETTKGDVLVLLPDTFRGPIHITADEPFFGTLLASQLSGGGAVSPSEGFWTAEVLGMGVQQGKRGTGRATLEHGVMAKVARFVPQKLLQQVPVPEEYMDMARGGVVGISRGQLSKVTVKSEKGRVAFGLRESRDVDEVRELRLRVGADSRPKHFWQ